MSETQNSPGTKSERAPTDTEPTSEAVAEQEDDAEEETEEEEEPLLPAGNPLRYIRGPLLMAAGMLGAFCLMAVKAQHRFGVALAALAVLVATFGVLDLLGSFDDPDDRVAGRAGLRALGVPLGFMFGGAFGLWALVTLAVDGRLSARFPVLTAGVLIPATFLVAVVGAYKAGEALGIFQADPDGAPRPLHARHGFWLIVVATLLYLPLLGSHSLSDPWETHYGEVARELLARDDWISTWWAQDGWFWSKPVLDFWIMALSMATFGVHTRSNQVLSAVAEGRVPWPEWALRLPVFLMTVLAVYLLYKAVARVYGRRAGLLGGVVLMTMPQWFLLTHQTMTDMPFAAPMAAAMGCFLLGAHEDPDATVRVYELDLVVVKLRLSGYHLVLGAIVACTLPQVLYLVSRNVSLDIRGFHAHLDVFAAGSPGNCGMPGNEACHPASAALRDLHPSLQAFIWAQALALVVYMSWGERRRQRLYFLAAWLFAAVSTMAKGPAGLGLPVLCALAYIAVSGRWRDLTRMEIAAGVLTVLAVALPWYVAMYARHGQPFTDRLIFHDMFKRAFTHVHDTNEGEDVSFRFYVWQLGYAMFPWTGLVPAALVHWLRRTESPPGERPSDEDRKTDASIFLAMWFVFAFALFSLMLTKFHHYILPAIPPAAMLTGVLLDALITRAKAAQDDEEGPPLLVDRALYAAGHAAGTVALLWGATRIFTVARGPVVPGGAFIGPIVTGAAVASAGVVAIWGTVAWLGRAAPTGDTPNAAGSFRSRFERVQLGAAAMAGAVLVFFVGRDLSAVREGMPNQIRLMHLVTYNYRRPWPPSLDFTGTLWGFTAVAAAVLFLLAITALRRHVVSTMVALGLAFAVWGLDVYFMRISPHWGQRETTIAYYQAARELPGPLIAYQMNWKGENFYTGNHLPAFVSSGKKFQDYVSDQKKRGVKTFYFVTEHGRTGTLTNEIGTTKSFEKLTTPELNNKFVLVRATFE